MGDMLQGRELPLGAHLKTSRPGYTHHGIYVGDGYVVHYSGLSGFWHCGPVEEVPLSQFAIGRPMQVVNLDQGSYSPQEIVRRARAHRRERVSRADQ
jgi:hypothetical protein